MNAVIDDPFSHEIAPVFCGLSSLAAPPSEQTSNVSAAGVNTALTVSSDQLFINIFNSCQTSAQSLVMVVRDLS
jgi:hypothetical protein